MDVVTTRFLCVILMLLLAACVSSREADNDDGDQPEPSTEVTSTGPEMASTAPDVYTVQLFPTSSGSSGVPPEAELPVVSMDDNSTLTLKFDVLEAQGRPLSVHFYHADRSWERDLSPGEYLRGFQRDEILDYNPSQGTEERYTHYSYSFPNENIDFLVSGNYLVRVAEQDNEDNVLFERAFFVTEQAANLDLLLDDIMRPGQSFPSVQPVARFRPPSELSGNVFDFSVCFAQNGRYDQVRCTDRPSLAEQPSILFDLDSRHAFQPEPADFRLVLNTLRSGTQIESADFSTIPYQIVLQPDYARFPDAGLSYPLNRQSVTSQVQDVDRPDISGEYVMVRFRYVPLDDQPLSGEVYVSGSFNNWAVRSDNRMTWNIEQGYYEGEALVKQGEHEYTYVNRDGQRREELRSNVPRRDHSISAFVYYYDMNLNTDRLLSFGGVRDRF